MTTLSAPRQNFGFLPTGGFLAHCFIVVFILLLPLLFALWQLLTNAYIAPLTAFSAGFRLLLLFIYAKIIFFSGTSLGDLYMHSKKVRYVNKTLIPFLVKRYGIKVDVRGSENVWHFINGQPVTGYRGEGKDDEQVRLIGWESVEEDASGRPVDLEDNVYLVEKLENELYSEFARVDNPDHESQTFHSTPGNVSLGATESFMYATIGEMLASLPQGTAMMTCFPRNTDFGIKTSFAVFVDDDYCAHYSLKEFSSFIETVIFNTRLSDEALMICSLERDDKTFFWGRVIHNFGYFELSVQALQRLSQQWEGFEPDNMVFVEKVSEIPNPTSSDH